MAYIALKSKNFKLGKSTINIRMLFNIIGFIFFLLACFDAANARYHIARAWLIVPHLALAACYWFVNSDRDQNVPLETKQSLDLKRDVVISTNCVKIYAVCYFADAVASLMCARSEWYYSIPSFINSLISFIVLTFVSIEFMHISIEAEKWSSNE